MIRLIVSDMDGTLLNEEGKIPTNFWQLERQLQKQGIHFCVASGRQYFNLENLFSEIKDNTIFIAENGALVLFQEQVICENPMDTKHISEWNQMAKTLGEVQLIFCGRNGAYIESPKSEKLLQEIKKYYHRLTIVEHLEDVKDHLLKIAICDPQGSEKNLYPKFQKYEGSYQVVVSGGMWLDIMPPTTNKGNALEAIKTFFHIGEEELLIFGDYLNDMEMMSCGKYSFAMKNAHPLLKKKANYLAPSNKEEGVLQVIQRFISP